MSVFPARKHWKVKHPASLRLIYGIRLRKRITRFAGALQTSIDARLRRSLRSQRVGWEREGKAVYGILIPDPLLPSPATGNDWYLYYVWGETLFRRSEKERAQRKMLVLPEAAEDWAELLRQALREDVFDVRYSVAPHHVNAFGDVEHQPSGYEFTLSAHGPHSSVRSSLAVSGIGPTPEAAAREAVRRWLDST